jgi:orotidine-5'-phosphate decarboxylase
MKFLKKLSVRQKTTNSLLCIGLDPVLNKLPKHLLKLKRPFLEFNKLIINATQDLVCAYKPNVAFYQAEAETGLLQLQATIKYIKKNYPAIPVILDAKIADIGHTNKSYIKYLFDYLDVDAVTINPYLGKTALEPFFQRKQKGLIILCKSSNPGSEEFQDLKVKHPKLGHIPLYQVVAYNVSHKWNKYKNCLLVVGATYHHELKKIRQVAPDLSFLVPGVGFQKGDLRKTMLYGRDKKGRGMIINVSRDIIYAGKHKNFITKVRQKAKKYKRLINKFR